MTLATFGKIFMIRFAHSLRMLVIMDDLDRIQMNMREIFDQMRWRISQYDLSGFDREVVMTQLWINPTDAKNKRNNAEKYLGKIIQMSRDLPPVNSVVCMIFSTRK